MSREPEISREMAVENLKTVASRLGVTHLPSRVYQQEGSFSVRSLTTRFSWVALCRSAGLSCGKVKANRCPCLACRHRLSQPLSPYCRNCVRSARAEKDHQALFLLSQGLTLKEIGAEMGVTARMIKTRMNRMKRETGALTLPHLIKIAMERKML